MNFNDALIWVLKTEHRLKDKSGIYGFTQRTLAYNSNRIEGSTLSEKQTTALFEEGFFPAGDDIYRSKDIEEMTGHFLMFNKMINTLEEELSETLIKDFHYELKAGVFEDRANGYAIGEYKARRNLVGGMETTLPNEVPEKMRELLEWYKSVNIVTIETLAEFHVRYEKIHPFQDGNGRTGRLILFRECLKQNIIPFIIHSENREKYIFALQEAEAVGNVSSLAAIFAEEQKIYAEKCREFDVESRFQQYNERNQKDRDVM